MPPRNAMIDAMANALDTGVGAQGVRNKMAQEYGAMYDPRYSDFPSTGMNIGSQTPYGGQWGGMSSPVVVNAGVTQAEILGNWGPTQNYEGTPLHPYGPNDPNTPSSFDFLNTDPRFMTGEGPWDSGTRPGYYVPGKETDEYVPFDNYESVPPIQTDPGVYQNEFVPSQDRGAPAVPVIEGGPDRIPSCPIGYAYDQDIGACVKEAVSQKMQGLNGEQKFKLINDPGFMNVYLQKKAGGASQQVAGIGQQEALGGQMGRT